MSLSPRLIRKLEFKLVLWFSSGFIVLALLLFAFISFQLNTSIRIKERQFVLEKASQYLTIAHTRGMASLLAHLDREQGPAFKTGMIIMITAPDGASVHTSLPKFWEAFPIADIPKQMETRTGEWVEVRGSGWFGGASDIDESDWLEVTSKKLNRGYTLYIGYSNEEIEETQARLRASIEKSVEAGNHEALMDSLMDCAEETELLGSIINTLMDISEAETGTMTLHPEEIPLSDLMDSVCDVYQIPSEEKQITLAKIVPGELSVMADPARLYQVIANLVDNAVKYTPSQGRVTLTASREGTGVKICVEDTGPGIPEEDIPRIFDRLFRCDRSRSQKGLGLGLSLVQAVVRAHNGTIGVENLKDRGTRFTLLLP
ncbi:MAG: HAMP domain-containing histidine kinase [Desulfobacteraceae bacterium]|nr:HAMP domain-containing histidine kinase [Desulfobacteraceae bacterium]